VTFSVSSFFIPLPLKLVPSQPRRHLKPRPLVSPFRQAKPFWIPASKRGLPPAASLFDQHMNKQRPVLFPLIKSILSSLLSLRISCHSSPSLLPLLLLCIFVGLPRVSTWLLPFHLIHRLNRVDDEHGSTMATCHHVDNTVKSSVTVSPLSQEILLLS
jgi:hypothetical protein